MDRPYWVTSEKFFVLAKLLSSIFCGLLDWHRITSYSFFRTPKLHNHRVKFQFYYVPIRTNMKVSISLVLTYICGRRLKIVTIFQLLSLLSFLYLDIFTITYQTDIFFCVDMFQKCKHVLPLTSNYVFLCRYDPRKRITAAQALEHE